MRGAEKAIMHPGPTNSGIEITGERAERSYSVILGHVSNGGAMRMTPLYITVGGGRGDYVD